ncbi:MAG: hypothetical protein B7Z15_16800, partial [Rhizobiales bacterium 32-66-8]
TIARIEAVEQQIASDTQSTASRLINAGELTALPAALASLHAELTATRHTREEVARRIQSLQAEHDALPDQIRLARDSYRGAQAIVSEIEQATGSPIATEALRRMAELYLIERTIRGRSPDERQRARSEQTRSLIDDLKVWMERELHRVPPRGGLADAIRYALTRWPALCRFLDDGRIEIDSNTVERAIRPIALGRKNHLFAGSDGGAERWAVIASLYWRACASQLLEYEEK